MSQLLAIKTPSSVILLADRRVEVHENDLVKSHSLRKLFHLGRSGMVATGGSAMGIGVSRKLWRLLKDKQRLSFDELESYALTVFNGEYEDFQRRGADFFANNPDAHKLSYILLAGFSENAEPRIGFYASENHGEPYRQLPISSVFSAPRRMGVESRLLKCLSSQASEEDLKREAISGLELISTKITSVGKPFDWGVLKNNRVIMGTYENVNDQSAK